MNGQPTPNVNFDDVDRIVERDYPMNERDSLRTLIEESNLRDNARVVPACLKISEGDLSRAEEALKSARYDSRDIVVAAEYPNCSEMVRIDELSSEERRRIYEKDWRQYSNWLNDR